MGILAAQHTSHLLFRRQLRDVTIQPMHPDRRWEKTSQSGLLGKSKSSLLVIQLQVDQPLLVLIWDKKVKIHRVGVDTQPDPPQIKACPSGCTQPYKVKRPLSSRCGRLLTKT